MTRSTRDDQSFVALDLGESIDALYQMSHLAQYCLRFWDFDHIL